MKREMREVLILTTDPAMPHIARDADGLGWRRFGGGAALTCHGCDKRTTEGYVPVSGGDARCHRCVQVRDYREDGDA